MIYFLLSIYNYIWPLLIFISICWLSARIILIINRTSPLTSVGIPTLLVATLTSPVWFEGLAEEIKCQNAGLKIHEAVEDKDISLYWESFSPSPNLYSLGSLSTTTNKGQVVMSELIRAVAEDRIKSFDIPYEPHLKNIPDSDRLYQRFFLTSINNNLGECIKGYSYISKKLAPDTCLAFTQIQGIQSTYELAGSALTSETGDSVFISRRRDKKILAEYRYVEPRVSDTSLVRFGVRSLRPWSCTPEMQKTDYIFGLIHLVFSSPNAKQVDTRLLEAFRTSQWMPIAAPPVGEIIPKGRKGIDYWIEKGMVRQLVRKDLDLWKRASGKANWSDIPQNAYMITGDIQLPDGLYGGNSVYWVVGQGKHIPLGLRGHSTFFEVDKGCVWSPLHCDAWRK